MHASIRQEPRSVLHVMARELSLVRALNRYRIIIALLRYCFASMNYQYVDSGGDNKRNGEA
jgi:hypothetical protein